VSALERLKLPQDKRGKQKVNMCMYCYPKQMVVYALVKDVLLLLL